MNKTLVAFLLLALVVTISSAIPSLILYQVISSKLDKIDTGVYNCAAYKPVLTPTEASKSATPSGKVK